MRSYVMIIVVCWKQLTGLCNGMAIYTLTSCIVIDIVNLPITRHVALIVIMIGIHLRDMGSAGPAVEPGSACPRPIARLWLKTTNINTYGRRSDGSVSDHDEPCGSNAVATIELLHLFVPLSNHIPDAEIMRFVFGASGDHIHGTCWPSRQRHFSFLEC